MGVQASGAVVPAGTIKSGQAIAPGTYEITIEAAAGENDGLFARDAGGGLVTKDGAPVPAASEYVMARCVYPDGWVKDHQVAPDDVAGLFEKITGQLRGRYGAGEVKLLSAPETVAAGATIIVEV